MAELRRAPMRFPAGSRFGPYEVVAPLGSGGMGEVYKARDARLDRFVALKVLPPELGADPQFRERFEREARAVAALNHPHICTIHDVGRQDSTDFLVLEFLEGETLADWLSKGALTLETALQYAVQIADALDRAHRAGIVHRDLKPGNVMVTKAGAKLLDFGLAKSIRPPVATTTASMLPTTPPMTAQGTILGTFQYIAPEQLEGDEADARTDIFAFGALLYEMITGAKAFTGKSQASLIGAIMHAQPAPMASLQSLVPGSLDRIVRTCLEKDPDDRWQTARDLLRELRWAAEPAPSPVVTEPIVRPFVRGRGWQAVAVASVAGMVAIMATTSLLRRPPATTADAIQFSLTLPEGSSLALSNLPAAGTSINLPLAVSPDGRRIVFLATNPDGTSRLWVRALDELTARDLPGTDRASSPFWSPDSRSIGFFADGRLKTIGIDGSRPATVCLVRDTTRGGAWGGNTIVFSDGSGPLKRVDAAGGTPTDATTLAGNENNHTRPSFLPDGQHFFFHANNRGEQANIYVGSLASTERTLVIKATEAANVAYSAGYLLFVRNNTLMAQPFDTRQMALTGAPVPIAERIRAQRVTAVGLGLFSASANGVLVYQTGSEVFGAQLVWLDRSGKRTREFAELANYGDVNLAPDAKQAAVSVFDPAKGAGYLSIIDTTRGIGTRLLPAAPFNASLPVWSPDGTRIVFRGRRADANGLFMTSLGARSEPELLVTGDWSPYSWSHDGRLVLYVASNGGDMSAVPVDGDRKPFSILKGATGPGQFSPDGRWIAYFARESDRQEVFVMPFPGPGASVRISAAGGTMPRWRRNERELFYLTPENKLMAVAVDGHGATFEIGETTPLFNVRPSGGRHIYDVAPDGQQFLFSVEPAEGELRVKPPTVVVNWPALLRK